MNAQQLELLFVATVDVALGCVLLAVDPARLPDRLHKLVLRMGRFRKRIGIVAIVVGVSLAIESFTGVR